MRERCRTRNAHNVLNERGENVKRGKEKLKILKRRGKGKRGKKAGMGMMMKQCDEELRGSGSNSGQIYVSHPLIHTDNIHSLYSFPMNKKGFDRNQRESVEERGERKRWKRVLFKMAFNRKM